MSVELIIIVFLLAFCLIREILYQKQVKDLLNRLMSRNYYDFKISETVAQTTNATNQIQIPVDEEPAEDFRHLSDFQV